MMNSSNRLTHAAAALALAAMLASPWAFATEGTHLTANELAERDDRLVERILGAVEDMEPDTIVQPVRELQVQGEPVVQDIQRSEALTVSYAYRDDGSCRRAGHTVAARFDGAYPTIGLDVSALTRIAPSGGDCEVDGLSYAITLAKDVGRIGDFDVRALFAADKRSTSAPYAITDAAGNVLLRADGNASDAVILPAGAAETVTGALILCRGFGDPEEGEEKLVEFCGGGNVVPVDWADGSIGRTAHLSASARLCATCMLFGQPLRFSLDVQTDVGNGLFGDIELRGDLGILSASIRHGFGLNELDNGAPPVQDFAGLPAVLAGAPTDTSTVFSIGARWSI